MLLILCLGLFVIGFYYKKFLVNLVIRLLKWKIDNYNIVKQDTFKLKNTKKLGEHIVMEYNIIYKDKNHDVIFVNKLGDNLLDNLNDFDYLTNKNMIVHCSITNNNGEDIIDITDEFRKFCYYYKTNNLLLPFFNVIQAKINNNIDNLNIFDYNITIYLNDLDFTEYTYSINETSNYGFDILFTQVVQDI